MEISKQWYQSRTVWGALIAVGSSLVQLAGVHIDPQMQGDLAGNMVSLSGALGGLLAVYGRLQAETLLK